MPDGCPPRNLQLYFYDTDHEVENRVSEVGHLDEKIVSDLIEVMSHNPYAKFFRSLKDLVHSDEFSISLQSCPSLDQRIYNAPTTSQVAAVWIEDFEGSGDNRNIRVYAHSGRAKNIQYYYGCYDPLQYPLLFPFGDAGWHEGIERVFPNNTSTRNTYASALYINANDVSNVEELLQAEEAVFLEGKKRRSVSCREYYAYKFQMRSGDTSLLLHTGRLFQQFIVDIYIKVETQRLDYFRKKQQLCRSENFQGLVDSVGTGAVFGNDVGRRVILPSSFIGGPRDMRGRYMDAMSLVQNFGKPDFFLTITCNPNWPEIKRLLEFNDEAQNRPDLVARVFHAKLQELKNDIIKKHFFGEISAYTYVIEFQKRGLPHAHFLIILKNKSMMSSSSFVDEYVCAEIPNKETQPTLYDLVKKHMVHGPCGSLNQTCPCMVQKKCQTSPSCKSKYPRSFCPETRFDDDSYPIYKRRNTSSFVQIKGFKLDNRWIVPYNPQLLLKFDCHINVELEDEDDKEIPISSPEQDYRPFFNHAENPPLDYHFNNPTSSPTGKTLHQIQQSCCSAEQLDFDWGLVNDMLCGQNNVSLEAPPVVPELSNSTDIIVFDKRTSKHWGLDTISKFFHLPAAQAARELNNLQYLSKDKTYAVNKEKVIELQKEKERMLKDPNIELRAETQVIRESSRNKRRYQHLMNIAHAAKYDNSWKLHGVKSEVIDEPP
nr:uncharacterized protein LOC109173038 [Ipomoea batatas]